MNSIKIGDDETVVCYAEIDENNICVGVSELADYVEAENLIEIESYDITLLGKLYNNGEWVDPNTSEEPSEEESQEEPGTEPSEESAE